MNKMVKRIAAAGIAAAMIGSMFAGCSANDAKDTDSTNETKTYKVGICQLVQHDALDAATEGFKDALKEKLGDAVEIDFQNASNGFSNMCNYNKRLCS